MPERPRLFLTTEETESTEYVDLLAVKISDDAKGISYFVLSIDPDPNALYRIIIAKILDVVDLEVTAIWTVSLPHLTSGVYRGLNAGDAILVRHMCGVTPAVAVKTGISIAFNEVIE